MDRYLQLALVVTRIYGTTFLAIGLGWSLVASAMWFLGPQWKPSAEAYSAEAFVYLLAGVLVVGLSRRIAKFSAKP
jgi:hypothetical protein